MATANGTMPTADGTKLTADRTIPTADGIMPTYSRQHQTNSRRHYTYSRQHHYISHLPHLDYMLRMTYTYSLNAYSFFTCGHCWLPICESIWISCWRVFWSTKASSRSQSWPHGLYCSFGNRHVKRYWGTSVSFCYIKFPREIL